MFEWTKQFLLKKWYRENKNKTEVPAGVTTTQSSHFSLPVGRHVKISFARREQFSRESHAGDALSHSG